MIAYLKTGTFACNSVLARAIHLISSKVCCVWFENFKRGMYFFDSEFFIVLFQGNNEKKRCEFRNEDAMFKHKSSYQLHESAFEQLLPQSSSFNRSYNNSSLPTQFQAGLLHQNCHQNSNNLSVSGKNGLSSPYRPITSNKIQNSLSINSGLCLQKPNQTK